MDVITWGTLCFAVCDLAWQLQEAVDFVRMRLGRFTDLAFRIKDRSLVGKEGTKWNEGGSRRERMQLSVCSKVVKDALRAN